MTHYKEIKLVYSCPAIAPENIYINHTYFLDKDKNGLYFTDGNYVEYCDESYVQMLFSPIGESWENVDFKDEVKAQQKKK